MKPLIIAALLAVCSLAIAKDKNEITYVGQGRYSCSGKGYKCAQIDQQNRLQSQIESDRYERNRSEERGRYERSREEYREREGSWRER